MAAHCGEGLGVGYRLEKGSVRSKGAAGGCAAWCAVPIGSVWKWLCPVEGTGKSSHSPVPRPWLFTRCPEPGCCRAEKGQVEKSMAAAASCTLPQLCTPEMPRLTEAACLASSLYVRESYGAFKKTSSYEVSTGLVDTRGNGDRGGASWGLAC